MGGGNSAHNGFMDNDGNLFNSWRGEDGSEHSRTTWKSGAVSENCTDRDGNCYATRYDKNGKKTDSEIYNEKTGDSYWAHYNKNGKMDYIEYSNDRTGEKKYCMPGITDWEDDKR